MQTTATSTSKTTMGNATSNNMMEQPADKPDSLAFEAKVSQSRVHRANPRSKSSLPPPPLTSFCLSLFYYIQPSPHITSGTDAKMPSLDEAKLLLQTSPSLTSEDDGEPKSIPNPSTTFEGSPPLGIEGIGTTGPAPGTEANVTALSEEEASSTLALEKLKAAEADPEDVSNMATAAAKAAAAAAAAAEEDVQGLGTAPTMEAAHPGQDNLALMSSLTSHIQV